MQADDRARAARRNRSAGIRDGRVLDEQRAAVGRLQLTRVDGDGALRIQNQRVRLVGVDDAGRLVREARYESGAKLASARDRIVGVDQRSVAAVAEDLVARGIRQLHLATARERHVLAVELDRGAAAGAHLVDQDRAGVIDDALQVERRLVVHQHRAGVVDGAEIDPVEHAQAAKVGLDDGLDHAATRGGELAALDDRAADIDDRRCAHRLDGAGRAQRPARVVHRGVADQQATGRRRFQDADAVTR